MLVLIVFHHTHIFGIRPEVIPRQVEVNDPILGFDCHGYDQTGTENDNGE
jgi:hypothetical protein